MLRNQYVTVDGAKLATVLEIYYHSASSSKIPIKPLQFIKTANCFPGFTRA